MRRHQSPKRHGVTSRARLRSRTKTKTRGRSRKAMRGGAGSGSPKNSSMLPWIAGAALVGAGGLLFGARYIQQLQTQLKAKTTELQKKTEEVASLSSQPGLIELQKQVAALNQKIAKTEQATREAARDAAKKLQESETAVRVATVAVRAASALSDKEKHELQQKLDAKTSELTESKRLHVEAQNDLGGQQQLSEEARAAVEAANAALALAKVEAKAAREDANDVRKTLGFQNTRHANELQAQQLQHESEKKTLESTRKNQAQAQRRAEAEAEAHAEAQARTLVEVRAEAQARAQAQAQALAQALAQAQAPAEAQALVEASAQVEDELYLSSLKNGYEDKIIELRNLIDTQISDNSSRKQKQFKNDLNVLYLGLLDVYHKKLTDKYTPLNKIVEFLAKQENLCNYIKNLRGDEDFITTVKSILDNHGKTLQKTISDLDFLFFKFYIQKISINQFGEIKDASLNTCNVEIKEYIRKLEQMYDLQLQLKK